jgi:hypothetical protein
MAIDLSKITFGAELELGDVDTKIVLPPGNKWCDKDGSICNSNGTANDPKKIFNRYGGEIQMKPENTPEELLRATKEIYDLFSKKHFNFTTNLHVHIRIPGLKDDLEALKKIAAYLRKYDEEIYELIDPNPFPERQLKFSNPDFYNGAVSRWRRRNKSHRYRVSEKVYKLMMNAKSPREFYEAHAPKNRFGQPMWHVVVRAGVNLKQIFEDTETIEFRHFTMSPDLNKMLSAYKWPKLLMEAIFVTGHTPKQILENNPDLVFQNFHPYDHELDKIFRQTNVYHNKRSEVRENYKRLIEQGSINEQSLY